MITDIFIKIDFDFSEDYGLYISSGDSFVKSD